MQLNKNVFLQNTYISYLHKQNPIIHNVFLSFKSMLEIFLSVYVHLPHSFKGLYDIYGVYVPQIFKGRFSAYFEFF